MSEDLTKTEENANAQASQEAARLGRAYHSKANVNIIVDSCADFAPEVVEALGVEVVSFSFVMGGQEHAADGGAQAGERADGDRGDARHDHAARQKQDAELVERLREQGNEMKVALRHRDAGGKAHRRTDRDDERRVRHRLVELLEGGHRIHR